MATLLALVTLVGGPPGFAAQDAAPSAVAPVAAGSERRIDPEADRLLRQMCEYLGNLQAFTVRVRSLTEVLLVDGQKLNFEASSQVTVKRPNRVRSHRIDVLDEADFYYDGATITLYSRTSNFYATEPMRENLDAALDTVRSTLALEVPGADLLYSDAYDGMTWDMTEAMYVGLESIGSVKAHHLAFRTPSIDFQVWVGDGDLPLPYKYIITTKWTTAAPQFGVELTDWNVSPTIDDAVFSFSPPPSARKIEFLKMSLPQPAG
jgi:hypothetical protein